ncbi:MAG: M48 family metallopeptidase [Bdellovibrionaceae bacterium]|nr:M48 family metallopeptidase [Pseudobdellovibrionaceae bacterium]MBX3033817.1 M48 family metallopeptidase [Pseudobdellovibrionaceae bacterium]
MTSAERIEYRGWTIEVQRKAFRRSLSITLKPGRPLMIKTSLLTSFRTICEFIDSREEWIRKHLGRFDEQAKLLPSASLTAGGRYPFFGRELELKPVLTPLEKIFFSATDTELLLHVPVTRWRALGEDLSFAHEKLRDFYRREAGRDLIARVERWASQTGLRPTGVTVREARARWGSCHPRGSISLNWRLAVYRPEVIDYVVVHELAHLRHMNHSRHFWELVESILPEGRALGREIRDQHRLSDFLENRR